MFCMRKHLQLGFPLDLYSPEDYAMVFWRAFAPGSAGRRASVAMTPFHAD